MKSKQLNFLDLNKEIGITINTKETRSQLKLIGNNYVTILHQPVTVSWNTCSQIHVRMYKWSILQQIWGLFPTLAGAIAHICYTSQSKGYIMRMCRECFICTCIWLHVFELRVTGWCTTVTQQLFLTVLSWLLVPALYCNPYLYHQIQFSY